MKTNKNIVGHEPWWFHHREQKYKRRNFLSMEMIIRKSIMDTLKEYWHTTSICGIKQIRNSENSRFERFCYIAIFCITFSIACMFLQYTWVSTFKTPLIVTAESFRYPIKDIDFPAVALCNFNRISKKALEEYTSIALEESVESGRRNITLAHLRNYLQAFGRLVDYLYDPDLQRIIDDAFLDESKLDIPYLMKKLSPRCEEMLIKCKWAGRDVNCSEIFHTRRTGLGYCCAFNYVLDMNSADRPTNTIAPVKRQKVPGPYDGLLVVADPMPEDNSYQKEKRNGFQVLIYDPQQFPEMRGGRALYRIAQPNQVEVLQIKSIKQYAAAEVHNYPRTTRKCLFHNELKKSFNNMYSYSACLVKCRIETIKSLCKCIPFFYPSKIDNDTKICTLRDLRCLDKFHVKLLYLHPLDTISSVGLETELADSLYCPNCLPDCEPTKHFTRNFKVSISNISRLGFGNDFVSGLNITNKCILSIHHPVSVGILHRLDVTAYWYEILSNIGGFSGMVMGIGYFTFVEFFYFIVIRFPRTLYIIYKKYH